MAEVPQDVSDEQPEAEPPEVADEGPKRSALFEAVRAPISASDPVGSDVKYEDSFQQLKAEVDKVQSANADADFELIVELGTRVLTELSKDLTAASYLGIGLLQTKGIAGVAEGVAVMRVLCETYWDDLYPPARRMVARKNALQLLTDRTFGWLEPQKPSKSDREPLTQAGEDFKALQAFVMEHMGEDAPVLSRLSKLLDTKLRAVPKDAPPPPPPPSAGDGAPVGGTSDGAASTSAPRPPSGGVSIPDEFRSPSQAAAVVVSAAKFLREHNKTDPAPFRLARGFKWGALLAPPPAENGKTMIPPYIEQRKAFLSGLLDRAQFAELVDEAEVSFYEFPLWLDLQRYVVTAMDALGGSFSAARDGVAEDVAGFVRRFPDLPALTFSEGTPFADGATREWIETRIRPLLGGGGERAPAAGGGDDSALEAEYAEAREHLTKGNLDAAVALLAGGADRSGQERFRRRLYLAGLCLRGGRPAVARPLLERLDTEIDAHRLDVWQPALALDLWTTLHGCYEALQRTADASEKAALQRSAEQVYEKICATDPSRALSVSDGQVR